MIPLLVGSVKGLLGSTAKNAVKKKALGTAKDFVAGKKKGKKGGALVKSQSAGSTGNKTKAKVKPTQSYVGNGVSSSSSATKAKVASGGEVSYEKLTQQLDNIVGVSDELNKAISSQYAFKEEQAKKKKKVRENAKKKERERQLEDRKPARKLGILAGVGAAGKKFGIFDFLINTLMGGLAGLLINNLDTIKNFFGGLGGAFNTKMNLLKWGLTALRKPIQAASVTIAKVFKPALAKLGSGLKKGLLGVGGFIGNGLKKIGTGVFNFAKTLLSKVTGAGAGTAKTLASSGTRGATSAATGTAKQLGTGTASKAAEKTFTKQGAKRLGLFSKAFKRIPLVGSIIGIGIDLAMGESLDRAIVGAIGAALGSTIGAFIGQGLIPIPGLGALVGGAVGAGIGDYLAKELYGNISKNLIGQGLSPLGDDAIPEWRKQLDGGQEPWTPPDGNTPTGTGNQTTTTSRATSTTSRATSTTSRATVTGGGSDFWTLAAIASLEDSDAQGRADVAQSIYNRAASGAYGGKNIRDLIIADGQYQPTWDYPRKNPAGDRANPEWLSIVDAQTAAAATGKSVAFVEQAARDIMNPTLQKNAIDFLGGRTDFTNYPSQGRRGEIYRSTGGKNNYFGWDWNYTGNVQGSIPNFGVTSGPGATQPSASSIQLASTSSGGLTNIVPTANLQQKGVYAGDDTTNKVGMSSGRGQRWGKHHAGVDIGTSQQKGWYVAFKLSGTVTDAGTFPGYGKTVIITSGDKDFLFGHLAQITVRKGQQYNGEIIGEIGKTGGGNTKDEHLHFEVSPKGTGGYGKDEDPMPYVKYLQIGRLDPSGTPTPTTRLQPSTSTAARAQGVQQRASYEGGGSQVVTVPIPAGGQQQMMVGGQAGAIVLGGSTKAMVNSYYKSQLMGFLYKQG